jgi:hypothetical protein
LVIIVLFEFWFSNLLADKLDLEGGSSLGGVGANKGGATSCAVAVLPSHPARDVFVRTCSTALSHRIVLVKHVHVEVATGEVQLQIIEAEGSRKIPGHVVHIVLSSQGDGTGKRYVNKWVGVDGDILIILGDLRDAVVQEEHGSMRGSVIFADELKVLRPEAARPDTEWVLEAHVPTALLTTGKRGGGGKSRPVRRLASFHAGCPHRCRM